MTHQRSLEVTEGPSKFDLMCAQFDGKVVKFSVRSTSDVIVQGIPCHIQGISCEDGSRESWIISGYFLDPEGAIRAWSGEMIKYFVMYFETKKRHGRLLRAETLMGIHL